MHGHSDSLAFETATLSLPDRIFDQLEQTNLEQSGTGRLGGILVEATDGYRDSSSIPVVRSTAIYHQRAQPFNALHHDIIRQIRARLGGAKFNNALIEIYGPEYGTMKFHSDCGIDLKPDTYIALYSCYQNPATPDRALIVKNKLTGSTSQIMLTNNMVVAFSTETNKYFLHKIVKIQGVSKGKTEGKNKESMSNKWLGITFRRSKTFVKFDDIRGVLMRSEDGEGDDRWQSLRLANAEERQLFYRERSIENETATHRYPEIDYTVSPSDLLPLASVDPVTLGSLESAPKILDPDSGGK